VERGYSVDIVGALVMVDGRSGIDRWFKRVGEEMEW